MSKKQIQDQVELIFNRIKSKGKGQWKRYDEEIHCRMILKAMLHKGRYSTFCTEALISEGTFRLWIKEYPLFAQCYGIGKMFARENWEI